jgi:hypothetical protein
MGKQPVQAAFLHEGRTLVSTGFDQTIRLWDVASGTEHVL